MKASLKLHLLWLAALGAVASAQAQGTAFTYQGRLNQNNTPATGIYDLQFTIYDSSGGPTTVAGPLTQNAVSITNGLFTTTLDFGAGIFTGLGRWLEIAVRTNGGPAFTNLSPRQALLPAPYAIHSGTASNVANGSVVKSLNTLKDNITLAAGANVTLATNANTLTISSTGPGGGVWSLSGANTYYNAGNVGIGTANPGAVLEIRAPNFNIHQRITDSSSGNSLVLQAGSGNNMKVTGYNYGAASAVPLFLSVDGANTILNSGGGNVGIGTQTPARKLTVFSSFHGIEHTDGTVRMGTYVGGTAGWFGTISNHKLYFFVNDGVASMAIDTAGNVGVGTTAPSFKLDVAGDTATTRLILRADPVAPANAAILCADPAVLNFVPYNTANARPMNLVVRDATVRQLTITGGADLAEPFKMSSEEIPKGAVVVIDADNPGHLKLSTEAYDTRVAGVVSGANGVRPGISLHQEGALEGGENVALSGRVYVHADATGGAIKPGDLLTTSATPGHAMKVGDHTRAQGAILGKAMTGLKEGQGLVLVLVTLQ